MQLGAPPHAPPPVADDDGDYRYYWSGAGVDVPIPRWLAEIVEIPFMVRFEIFVVGVCTGLIIGALAVLIGYYASK
jgi:hypothetical protein